MCQNRMLNIYIILHVDQFRAQHSLIFYLLATIIISSESLPLWSSHTHSNWFMALKKLLPGRALSLLVKVVRGAFALDCD